MTTVGYYDSKMILEQALDTNIDQRQHLNRRLNGSNTSMEDIVAMLFALLAQKDVSHLSNLSVSDVKRLFQTSDTAYLDRGF